MAIIYGTLAKELDDKVEYIYPKTVSEMVEYDSSESVKDKIDSMVEHMIEINNMIDVLVKEISSIKNDIEELQKSIVYI